MKKLYILILAFLLHGTSLFAQSGWQSQPSGTSANLQDVYFTSSSTGWAVGGYPEMVILKTTNGGDNWFSQTVGTNSFLWSVYFVTPLTGWAVGGDFFDEFIFKTTNGGDNWYSQTSGQPLGLYSVHFISPLTGWAVGGDPFHSKIIKTTSGGTNWTTELNGASEALFDVFFLPNSFDGWAVCADGTILRYDFGWTSQTSGTTAALYSVYFISLTTGWAVGQFGIILKTTDGGTNWIPQTSGTNVWLESVHFASASTGWAVGGHPETVMLKTTNGGTNWLTQSVTTAALYSVYFTSLTTGWAVGNNGTILKTTTGGIAPYNFNLSALIEGFYDKKSGYMKGDTINVYLRNSAPPFSIVDSAKKYLDSLGESTLSFYNAANLTPYYIVIQHRNSIETWSDSAMSFASNSLTYDFTLSASQAYGNNLILQGTEYCFYSGDVNQSGAINLNDIIEVGNNASNFINGYVSTDVTGDNLTNLADILITYNNSVNFVVKITP